MTVAEATAAAAVMAAAATAAPRRRNDVRQGGDRGGHCSHGSRGLVSDSVELGGYDLHHTIYSSKDYSVFFRAKNLKCFVMCFENQNTFLQNT